MTGTTGRDALWVPVVLALFGVGSFVGVVVAGRLADRSPGLVFAAGAPLLFVGWSALALLAARPAALLALVFALGVLSFAVGVTLIARVLYEADGAPALAGACATAALNIGAVLGPVLAATALGAGSGNRGPLWASASLVAVATAVALPFRRAAAGA